MKNLEVKAAQETVQKSEDLVIRLDLVVRRAMFARNQNIIFML